MAWSLEWTFCVVVESEVDTTNKTDNKLTNCWVTKRWNVTLQHNGKINLHLFTFFLACNKSKA